MRKYLIIFCVIFCQVIFCQNIILDNTGKVVTDASGNVLYTLAYVLDSNSVQPYVWFADAKMTKHALKWARFRRSSDNAEQDFYYVNDYGDTAGLRTWYGASATVYLVTRYDQMLRYDATQTNAANQPTWNKTNRYVNCALILFVETANFSSALNQPNTFYIVGAAGSVTAANQNWCGGAVNTNTAVGVAATTGKWRMNFGTGVNSANTSNTNKHLFRTIANGASTSLYIDGVLDFTDNAGANTLAGFTLGTAPAGISGMASGYYYLMGVFDSTPSSDDMTRILNYSKRTWSTP